MDELTLALVIVLVVLGELLLVAECFITSGFLALAAVALIATGIAIPFYVGDSSAGFLTLLGALLGVPGLFLLPGLGGRVLRPPGAGPDPECIIQTAHSELEALRGRVGRAVSSLRPSGLVDFDGKRVDTLTEGVMVDAGTWVRCIDVRSGRVIVRAIEGPDAQGPTAPGRPPTELEEMDLT